MQHDGMDLRTDGFAWLKILISSMFVGTNNPVARIKYVHIAVVIHGRGVAMCAMCFTSLKSQRRRRRWQIIRLLRRWKTKKNTNDNTENGSNNSNNTTTHSNQHRTMQHDGTDHLRINGFARPKTRISSLFVGANTPVARIKYVPIAVAIHGHGVAMCAMFFTSLKSQRHR